jgi:NAD(P)-dependent dehydrogenase (short-subunit alcohol dehydrogenase family)
MSKLTGKIAVITGASSGIGLATAEQFVAEGAHVYITGRRQKELDAAVALPLMSDGASIILNGSAASIKALSTQTVYSATKAAVRSFARTWTSELKERKIRVSTVSPGYTDTPIFETMGLPKEQVDRLVASILPLIPVGRFGRPEEIAKTVLFLASDDSSYITGVELFVDGGGAQI